MQRFAISSIRLDGGTQSRQSLSNETAQQYAQVMRDGGQFPPIVLFHDGSDYWLADGFHRVLAAQSADLADIDAEVRIGTKRDATLYSVGSNSAHGLPRTNSDKRNAVTMLLNDEEWSQWSDREIARRCGVQHQMVGSIRKSILGDSSSMPPPRTFIHHKTGTEAAMRTENIGRRSVADRSGTPSVTSPPSAPPRPESELPKSRGVALAYSAKAIEYLGMIPPNDALRGEALREVGAWIRHNR